jgi:hypothetical protein
LMKRSQASLSDYVNYSTFDSIFHESRSHLKLQMDSQCNTRAFYYCLLFLIYECDEWETARHLERHLKSHVYSSSLNLDRYKILEVDPDCR